MTLQKDLVSYIQHHTPDPLLTWHGGERTCGWERHHHLQQHTPSALVIAPRDNFPEHGH